jgi:hypothetical protein
MVTLRALKTAGSQLNEVEIKIGRTLIDCCILVYLIYVPGI